MVLENMRYCYYKLEEKRESGRDRDGERMPITPFILSQRENPTRKT
jgi:hypothetical protein